MVLKLFRSVFLTERSNLVKVPGAAKLGAATEHLKENTGLRILNNVTVKNISGRHMF